MNFLITTLLVFVTTFSHAQNIITLEEFDKQAAIPKGKAVFYGKFIQRLAFSSGGFPQDIRLVNLDTKEVLAFRVKPTFKSAKENNFCYIIDAGNYAILNYWWTKSQPLGGTIHTEPIFKGIDASKKNRKKLETGQIKKEDLQLFTFSLTENSLNYLGTWHFDTGLVSFSNEKDKHDSEIKNKYKKLDFSTSKVVLPN